MPQTLSDILRKDHSRSSRLLDQLENTNGDLAQRRKLFASLRAEIGQHLQAERDIVFPAFALEPETSVYIAEGLAEQSDLTTIVEELALMDAVGDDWFGKLEELRDELDRHVEDEELDMLPMAEAELGTERFVELGRRFEEARARLAS